MLLLLLLAGAGYAAFRSTGGEESGRAPATSAPSPRSASTAAKSSAAATIDPGAAKTTPATSSQSATVKLSAGCKGQLAAGQKVIVAADTSYKHWHGHTQADLDYRTGKSSWAKTQRIWRETKKAGDGDVARFRTAHTAYAKAAPKGCASLERADAGPAVTRCLERFKVVDKAVKAGDKVNGDWKRHVQMMKHKDHTNPRTYAKQWRSMVDGSGTGQRAYRTAKAAYVKAPSCAT